MKSSFLKLLLLLLAAILALPAETYKYSYDDMGRLTRAEGSSGLVITYKYDASGNLLRREIAGPESTAAEASKAAATSRGKKASKSKSAQSKGTR